MKSLLKILPWFFLFLFGAEIVAVMAPKSDPAGELHMREFGSLPVLLNGRIQPFDSVAHNSLLQMRSTGDLPLEILPSWEFWHHPKKLRSTEWLLEVFFKPEVADTRSIFLIHHPDLISELKLEGKGLEKSGLHYYSFNELQASLPEIEFQGTNAMATEDAQRNSYQKQVIKLYNAVLLYQRLKSSIEPEGVGDFVAMINDFQASVPAGMAAVRAQRAGQPADQDALKRFAQPVTMFDDLSRMALPMIVPPANPENKDAWANMGTALIGSVEGIQLSPAVGFFARMASAYTKGDVTEFNSAVAGYKTWLTPIFPKEAKKGRAEFYFNQIKLFLHGIIIYLFVFVLAVGALLTYGSFPNAFESLRRSSFYLLLFVFAVHTFALIFRMSLEGRPPVTNLYSSAIFIGWATCLIGILIELVYKIGLGCAVSGLAGFTTLLIAHNLAIGGDTMEMLRAVLDTNFWLATHVVMVTLGYSATFFAGLLALYYIVMGIFTPLLSEKAGTSDLTVGKALNKMIYAIICFATLFSFTGTVLGGLWADYSWGRFWGWDVKENGALLIVIWNALILHARWGGIVRERGLAVLAIFGNIVTSFSWFGVNMLGIGLHSYGFMDQAFLWLILFIVGNLAVIGIGCLPLSWWKSFRAQAGEEPADGSTKESHAT